MDIRERLNTLRDEQQKMAAEFESIVKAYNSDETLNENASLKKTLESYTNELAKLRSELSSALNENDRLKLTLQEQVWNEKLNILKISRQKLAVYFGQVQQSQVDQLTAVEQDLKYKLGNVKRAAEKNLAEGKAEFELKIKALENELEERLKQEEARYNQEHISLAQGADNEYYALKERDISPETLKQRVRQNQIEMKIGLNWLNKIGILLILLGVGVAYRYSFTTWMNNYLKAGSFFLLGGLFMLGGEIFYRKKNTVFASGLLGGGVAILYGSVFYSYFWLKPNIISMETALLLSILVTVSTVVLSLRYKSQTIGAFGLMGGFLPFLSFVSAFGLNEQNILLLMGYLFLLNLSVLLISLKKQWNVLNYLSFLLNSASLIYLASSGPRPIWGISYTVVTFAMYLSVTLAYPMINKKPLNAADVILLGLNTAISSVLVFTLCDRAGLGIFRGLMALLFGLFYLGLGQSIQKVLKTERWTQILFYATALTFAILVIPFQFDKHWWALGWVIEAVLLIILGSRNSIQAMETTGWVIFLICLFIFGCTDLLPFLFGSAVPDLEFRYFAITAAQIIVLASYQQMLAKHRITIIGPKQGMIAAYKYLVTIGCWIYIVHMGDILCRHWMTTPQTADYYRYITFALFTIVYGFTIARIKHFADSFTRGFGVFLYLVADLVCVGINLLYPVAQSGWAKSSSGEYWAFAILLIFNIFVLLNLRNLLLGYLRREGFSLENYPVLLGLYLFANSIGWMIVQFRLEMANLLFSMIFLVMALGFIGYGFIRRYMYIRHLGLGLAGLAMLKFFIWDLAYLGAFGQIMAFFGFGILLLTISYIYQKVKTNMEANADHAPKA